MTNIRTSLPDNWSSLTPEQKRQRRLNTLLNTEGINFVSPEAEKMYKIRAQRMVDVYNVEEPDEVPVRLPIGGLPLRLYGINSYTAMYDYDKAVEACKQFNEKYSEELEVFASPTATPGRILDILDYKLYAWPGHGLSKEASLFQFLEGEYITADEYDELLRDPSDFWLRTYLPRIFGAFECLRLFQPLTHMIVEAISIGQLRPLAMSQVQETLEKMLEVGKEYQRLAKATEEYARMGVAHGFPTWAAGVGCKAPFDTLADTLRGTRGIMMDMYRQPDKLLEVLDKIADLTIHWVLNSPTIGRTVLVGYALHKGDDFFMSNKQFETFYWPSLKKIMNAFIEEGLIQRPFAEGSFNTRLELINEFPKGTVTWYFDRTDMAKAKEILGANCCIQGNVPYSLLMTGEPHEVKEYCRKLIEVCGKGGGYILSAGSSGEKTTLENIRAMLAAVKEYGVYRK